MALICLDVHGVCADFIGGLIAINESRMTEEKWPKGVYDPQKVLKFDWNDLDEYFWATLKPTKEFGPLMELLKGHTILVTTRSGNGNQIIGTFMWYMQHLNPLPYIPTASPKGDLFQNNDMLLIDDCEKEIESWKGPSILVPRPWNNATGDPLQTITEGLAKCIS